MLDKHLLLDETDCVNAQSTQRLYAKLLATHPKGPVYVICDDARYYKNNDLRAWLARAWCRCFYPPIRVI